jgi:hypothetical protein
MNREKKHVFFCLFAIFLSSIVLRCMSQSHKMTLLHFYNTREVADYPHLLMIVKFYSRQIFEGSKLICVLIYHFILESKMRIVWACFEISISSARRSEKEIIVKHIVIRLESIPLSMNSRSVTRSNLQRFNLLSSHNIRFEWIFVSLSLSLVLKHVSSCQTLKIDSDSFLFRQLIRWKYENLDVFTSVRSKILRNTMIAFVEISMWHYYLSDEQLTLG